MKKLTFSWLAEDLKNSDEWIFRVDEKLASLTRDFVKDQFLLEKPLFEFFLKDDDLGDPLINRNHIVSFGWAKDDELDEMISTSHKVNELLTKLFADSGMILVDFKLEFGVSNGKILLGDEFTPDGCRLWDDETLEKLDKDRFRQDLGDVIESYHMVAHRLGMQIKVD